MRPVELGLPERTREVVGEVGARALVRQLVAEGRLAPARLADVVAWVLATEGADAARAAVAPFQGVVGDPRLLAVLEQAGV